MWQLLRLFAVFVVDAFRSRAELELKLLFLRQQLDVLTRERRRAKPDATDRLLLVFLSRFIPRWKDLLAIVRPETLLRWHRQGWRAHWTRVSCRPRKSGRRLTAEIKAAISLMAVETTWGPKRIVGELYSKLHVRVHKKTVRRILRTLRPPRPGGQRWWTFVRNHLDQIWACDFFTVTTWNYHTLHVFFVMKLSTREILHWAVTAHPNQEWVAQQFREVTAWCRGPRFLIRDRDDKFGSKFDAVARACGTAILLTPPRSPTANAYAERFVGTVRRELLNHVLVIGERGLAALLGEFVAHYNRQRPHQGIEQRIPEEVKRPVDRPRTGRLVSRPILRGLIHEYSRAG